MKIVIIGPGALGCLFAYHLSNCKCDNLRVNLLDHNEKRVSHISEKGITCITAHGKEVRAVRATADLSIIQDAEYVLICVKSLAVSSLLKTIYPHLSSRCLVVGLQNGISHLAHFQADLNGKLWAIGVTAHGATLEHEAVVRHCGSGLTRIGFDAFTNLERVKRTALPRLDKLISILNTVNIETTRELDITPFIWGKLIINIGINALTAIHGCRNGELLADHFLKRQMMAVVTEAAAVAEAKGIKLPVNPIKSTLDVCLRTSENISSMLQDITHRRKTEIEAINGALTQEARKYKIDTPMNDFLISKVKEMECSFLP